MDLEGKHGGHLQQQQQQRNYRNPCLTMHQPWASLLIHGIKRIEGRSWPSPIRGRLWIHAAAVIPDQETIRAMEEFYREIYKVDGVTDIKFPEHYPVSRLLGCVNVVGCLRREELISWEEIPQGVRLEGQTDFCWLCEQTQKLVVPFEMRGFQRIYNLEKKVFEGASRGLSQVHGPSPVTFPLPVPSDPYSLKPGSLASRTCETQISTICSTPNLSAAITGARAAATQFSKNKPTNVPQMHPIDRGNEHEFVEAATLKDDNDTPVIKEFAKPRTRSKTVFSGTSQKRQNRANGVERDFVEGVTSNIYNTDPIPQKYHRSEAKPETKVSIRNQTGKTNEENQTDTALPEQLDKFSHDRGIKSRIGFLGRVDHTRPGIRRNEMLAGQIGHHHGESSYKNCAVSTSTRVRRGFGYGSVERTEIMINDELGSGCC